MAKVISIQQKKINGDLQRYAEELETIDRMLEYHRKRDHFQLKKRHHQYRNKWLNTLTNWKEKWQK